MPIFDYLGPTDTKELNGEVWNQLVEQLRIASSPGTFRTNASTQYVEVHHDKTDADAAKHFPMQPGSVVIQETTDRSLISIEYILTGPGHLGTNSLTATSAANGSIQWKWFNDKEYTDAAMTPNRYEKRASVLKYHNLGYSA